MNGFRIADEKFSIQNEQIDDVQNQRIETLMEKIIDVNEKSERRFKMVSDVI